MLLNIIGFASLTHLIVDLIITIDKQDKVPQKPFKCDMCLGFWLSLPFNILMYGWEGVLISAITGITANLLTKYI